MTQTVSPATFIDMPRPTPLKYGLLSAAVVMENQGASWRIGDLFARSTGCITALDAEDPCLNPGNPAIKESSNPFAWVESTPPFSIYALAECTPVGIGPNPETQARDAFSLAEGRAVEAAFMRDVLAPSAVDLSVAGANTYSAQDGLAILEGFAASVYGGVATIHIPRSITSKLAMVANLQRTGNRIETFQGSIIASGGGYETNIGPDGTEAEPGKAWLYATGQVVLERAPTNVIGPVISTAPATNDLFVLVERTYAALVDCFVAAVQISTGCCSCEGAPG